MTKNTTTHLNLGLEIGNRTSVLALGPFGNSAKEKTILQPTTYKPHQERLGLIFGTANQAPGNQSIIHDGKTYFTGSACDGHDGSLVLTSLDKYRNSAGLQIMFKSLLAQVLPKGKDKSYTAKISFGMPIGWMNEDNMANVRAALSGKHHIQTTAGHYGQVEIKPASVEIYHEPLGGYAYALTKSQGNLDSANFLDIGYTTSDLLSIANGVIVESLTDTIDYGMHDLYMLLQRHFQPLEGYRRPIEYWENFVKTYKHNSNNASVGAIFNQFLDQLGNKVMGVWSGLHNKPNLHTLGGGGDFIYPYLQKAGLDVTKVTRSQEANALGLLYILLNNL